MSDYLSFCGDLAGERFWFSKDLDSHSGTAKENALPPDTYCEYEWKGESESSLSVRVLGERGDHDVNWYRACVLARWPTRSKLEEWLLANVPEVCIQGRHAVGGDQCVLFGGMHSKLVGGDKATLTGGHGSVLIGGHESVLTGGYRSVLIGGPRSTLLAREGAWLRGGFESSLHAGMNSTLIGGRGSVFAGGYGSVLVLYRAKYPLIGVVGRDGLEAHVAYVGQDDRFVPWVPEQAESVGETR